MAQGETDECPERERAEPNSSHALTIVAPQGTAHAGNPARRPLAGFVAQLIVSEDPRLHPSRAERTRKAAALYAEAARRRA
ncbi:hypothetical protein J2X36_000176 [Methylobacterium sp. BE186]|uniref:hypothetical protein n=1 Tax=Methylobacterium sp. BE186 TaxID=2817715 RepID=UPI00285F427C|nr:hypothetical protein [Methylobacterium sp. BE186]MDR7035441.1 hypothetical protein [Methylobacterium sp. BE186]